MTTRSTVTRRVEADYATEGPLYEAVCETIGWDASVRPVRVAVKTGRVYVSGTALKTREWRELVRWNGATLPDGREIRVRNVPDALYTGFAL